MVQLPGSRKEIAFKAGSMPSAVPTSGAATTRSRGFDCSGLVIEGLRSAGLLPRTGDWTARHAVAEVSGQDGH